MFTIRSEVTVAHNASYLLRYSRRAKRLKLEVLPGKVRITAPHGTPVSLIDRFFESRTDWITEKLHLFDSVSRLSAPEEYRDGTRFTLFGEEVVFKTTDSGGLVLSDGTLWGEAACSTSRVMQWLDEHMLELLFGMAMEYSDVLPSPSRIRLGNARSRWGSCSARGVVMINRKLVHAPRNVIRYVLVHEMVHLSHRNHSKVFWNAVERLLGDVTFQKEWLKTKGAWLLDP